VCARERSAPFSFMYLGLLVDLLRRDFDKWRAAGCCVHPPMLRTVSAVILMRWSCAHWHGVCISSCRTNAWAPVQACASAGAQDRVSVPTHIVY
jgi:hypothetical protein